MKIAAFIATAFLLTISIVVLGVLGGLAGERHCGVEASWYGKESCVADPCRTKSGELFTGNDLTAAVLSKSHIGERWRVSLGKKYVDVRINDTGNMGKYGRGIDLSKRAFSLLAPLPKGVISVCLKRLS